MPLCLQVFWCNLMMELVVICIQHTPVAATAGGGGGRRRGGGGGGGATSVTIFSAFSALSPISAIIGGIIASALMIPYQMFIAALFRWGNDKYVRRSLLRRWMGQLTKLARPLRSPRAIYRLICPCLVPKTHRASPRVLLRRASLQGASIDGAIKRASLLTDELPTKTAEGFIIRHSLQCLLAVVTFLRKLLCAPVLLLLRALGIKFASEEAAAAATAAPSATDDAMDDGTTERDAGTDPSGAATDLVEKPAEDVPSPEYCTPSLHSPSLRSRLTAARHLPVGESAVAATPNVTSPEVATPLPAAPETVVARSSTSEAGVETTEASVEALAVQSPSRRNILNGERLSSQLSGIRSSSRASQCDSGRASGRMSSGAPSSGRLSSRFSSMRSKRDSRNLSNMSGTERTDAWLAFTKGAKMHQTRRNYERRSPAMIQLRLAVAWIVAIGTYFLNLVTVIIYSRTFEVNAEDVEKAPTP